MKGVEDGKRVELVCRRQSGFFNPPAFLPTYGWRLVYQPMVGKFNLSSLRLVYQPMVGKLNLSQPPAPPQ